MMILDGPNPTPEEFKKWLEEMLEKSVLFHECMDTQEKRPVIV